MMSTKVDPYLLKRTVDISRDRSRAGRVGRDRSPLRNRSRSPAHREEGRARRRQREAEKEDLTMTSRLSVGTGISPLQGTKVTALSAGAKFARADIKLGKENMKPQTKVKRGQFERES